ncbi:MAG: DNA polymerase I, partial [Candidatus Wallbacteria bacterium]|nr:DNA polymerase I [Candidatus Wallbacteria bacterium]
MKILIVDGFNLIFRGFFAMFKSNLRNRSGFPTGAIHAFFNMLLKASSDLAPDRCLVALDTGKKTFRHEKFEGYKAKRLSPPGELVQQIPRIKELIPLMGWVPVEAEGLEA